MRLAILEKDFLKYSVSTTLVISLLYLNVVEFKKTLKYPLPRFIRYAGHPFELNQSVVLKALTTNINHFKPESVEPLAQFVLSRQNPQSLKPFIEHYERLLRNNLASVELIGLLAFCYAQIGQEKKAMKFYEIALTLKPNFFPYYFNLAVLLFKAQEFNDAKAVIAKGLSVSWEDWAKMFKDIKGEYVSLLMRVYPNPEIDILDQMKLAQVQGFKMYWTVLIEQKEYEAVFKSFVNAVNRGVPQQEAETFLAIAAYGMKGMSGDFKMDQQKQSLLQQLKLMPF